MAADDRRARINVGGASKKRAKRSIGALGLAFILLFTLIAGAAAVLLLMPDTHGGEPRAVVTLDTEDLRAPGRTRPISDLRATLDPAPGADRKKPLAPNRSAPVIPARPDGKPPESPAKIGALRPAPIAALTEETPFGQLPRVAADGRRPARVYARPSGLPSESGMGAPARIAILVTGMGLSAATSNEAISRLPGPVTLAFAPYAKGLERWAAKARASGHETMLQVPLEPFDYPDNDPGPHTLLTRASMDQNRKNLLWLMGRFTGYVGVTNYMGAKFTARREYFLPVLEEIETRGLIYVDDGSSPRSTAPELARGIGLGLTTAHVEIDAAPNRESIGAALKNLEKLAQENGLSVGVASGLPVTISMISAWAKDLKTRDIILIPVSAAVLAGGNG